MRPCDWEMTSSWRDARRPVIATRRLGQATQSLYINVDDVDKHFARAKNAGAKILEEPADTAYVHRRYGAEDPEGRQWYFASDSRRPKRKRNTH